MNRLFFWLGKHHAGRLKMAGWVESYLAGYADERKRILEYERLVRSIKTLTMQNGSKARILEEYLPASAVRHDRT